VAAYATDVGYADPLLVQGFDHGANAMLVFCLLVEFGEHWLIEAPAHAVLTSCLRRLASSVRRIAGRSISHGTSEMGNSGVIMQAA